MLKGGNVINTAKLADIYLRLSKEESRDCAESGSITNQRSVVRRYCEENGIIIVKEFVDDGYSGSNFNRPKFQEMLNHLRENNVNMVITKDLSRLGRDMIESSFYAEKFFPENGIRYLAISDNFDSQVNNIMAPFQFAMNDVYLRETSRKIKQVLNTKMSNGEYCACPPFGYMKDPNKKGRLIPDPNTAPTVKEIFRLASSGLSAYSIAKSLTEDGYITPLKYRVLYRDNFGEAGASRAVDNWNYITVKKILQNEVYLGKTILGKTKNVSVKSKKKINVPRDEWHIIENTHEPIISESDFLAASVFLKSHTKYWKDTPDSRQSIFRGIAFCAQCGSAMCSGGGVYNGERKKYWYLICNKSSEKNGKKCEKGTRIKYSDLVEIVKSELNKKISEAKINPEQFLSDIKNEMFEQNINDYDTLEKKLHKRLDSIDKILIKLYSDNVNGIINDGRLNNMLATLSKETDDIHAQLKKIECSKSKMKELENKNSKICEMLNEYTTIETLTPEIVKTFIERIEIGNKSIVPKQNNGQGSQSCQSIKILYRFSECVD